MQLLKLEWEKMGWINVAETVSSFPWPGLPSDVHFSFSYNPNSDKMNLHLTRNCRGVVPGDKPQIRIAQWPKAEMEEMAKMFFCHFWERVWKPFDMQKYQYRPFAKGRAARYCSISRMLKARKAQSTRRQLKTHFLQHLRQKKNGKHLLIQEGLLLELERLIFQPDFFWTLVDQFKRVPRKFSSPSEIGYLYTRDFSRMVLQIQGQWFTYNEDADLSAVLQAFFEPDIYEVLKEKVKKAIADISKATTKADTIPVSQPVDLTIIRQ